MKKWNIVIDVALCTNCCDCVLSCKDEYVGNSFPGYAAEMPHSGHRWINILRKERGRAPMVDVAYVPTMCNHCDRPLCARGAKGGAVRKRRDGIVQIVPEKAVGQRGIVEACPYGHVWWNEERQLPQHWPFDAHLLDQGWTKTRGSQICPTGAMQTVLADDDEMARMIEEEGLEVLGAEHRTRPRVYYKNLYRYSTCFIGGSVAARANGTADCVEGAAVSLYKASDKLAETVSDNYGDFKFDRLAPASGPYRVEIRAAGREAKSLEVDPKESVYLGIIYV